MPTSSLEFASVSSRMKFVALIAALSLACPWAQAQAPVAVATGASAAAPRLAGTAVAPAVKEVPAKIVPLSSLSSRVGAIRLTRLDGSANLSIPASRREIIKSAVLHLVTTNSISLNDRSQLVVRVNNRTVAQLQLSAKQPEITADIRLPAELLQPGYNQLSFRVAQHSQDVECEDPNAPELWTEIDTTASV